MVQRWIVGSIQTLAFLNQFFFQSFTHCIENALYVLDNDSKLELELIQTQMAQKPMLRAEVYAHAMRASQNRKKEVRREKKV